MRDKTVTCGIYTWTDVKGNAIYRPKEGDSYEDITGSGRFDAVWMAGFKTI